MLFQNLRAKNIQLVDQSATVTNITKVFKNLIYYRTMLKLLVLITSIIILSAIIINPYLISQVHSSSESSLSSDDNGDDNESNGSGSEDESPQDDSEETDSSSDGNEGEDNNDNNGIRQTDQQELIEDDDGVDEEPPTSTERLTDPIPGLVIVVENNTQEGMVKKCVYNEEGEVEFCFEELPPDKLCSLEPIEAEDPPLNPDVCVPPKEGIDTSNITTAATSELMN